MRATEQNPSQLTRPIPPLVPERDVARPTRVRWCREFRAAPTQSNSLLWPITSFPVAFLSAFLLTQTTWLSPVVPVLGAICLTLCFVYPLLFVEAETRFGRVLITAAFLVTFTLSLFSRTNLVFLSLGLALHLSVLLSQKKHG